MQTEVSAVPAEVVDSSLLLTVRCTMRVMSLVSLGRVQQRQSLSIIVHRHRALEDLFVFPVGHVVPVELCEKVAKLHVPTEGPITSSSVSYIEWLKSLNTSFLCASWHTLEHTWCFVLVHVPANANASANANANSSTTTTASVATLVVAMFMCNHAGTAFRS